MKNWTGNKNSVYKMLGASNHTSKEREANDYYATSPEAAEWLLKLEKFNNILEPACGEGHLSNVFIKSGKKVTSSDIIDRGFGYVKSFFEYKKWNGDIITNPPYKFALQFAEHALNILPEGNKLALFLKIQFLEGKKRKTFFLQNPPKTIYVSSSRLLCAKNAEFTKMRKAGGSAVAYAWFVWVKGYKNKTIIEWFN